MGALAQVCFKNIPKYENSREQGLRARVEGTKDYVCLRFRDIMRTVKDMGNVLISMSLMWTTKRHKHSD